MNWIHVLDDIERYNNVLKPMLMSSASRNLTELRLDMHKIRNASRQVSQTRYLQQNLSMDPTSTSERTAAVSTEINQLVKEIIS